MDALARARRRHADHGALIDRANRRHGLVAAELCRPASLVDRRARRAFWDLVWDFAACIGDKGDRLAIDLDRMPGARFFPDARLNFAENLLRAATTRARRIDLPGRGQGSSLRMSWRELQGLVSRLQQAMRAEGVGAGDRVAAMMPNRPETIAIMLAAASIGAVFSSCSPDFGERGVLDRFGQIEPKLFFAVDGYWYAGKRIDNAAKLRGDRRRACRSAATIVLVPYLGDRRRLAGPIAGATHAGRLHGALRADSPSTSSACRSTIRSTSCSPPARPGVPKCIVHGAGGTLLQHLKEHRLHCDIRPGDRVFYFTTCGWMMWNWLVSGLASRGDADPVRRLALPSRPAACCSTSPSAEKVHAVRHLGQISSTPRTRPGSTPRATHDLSALRADDLDRLAAVARGLPLRL